MEQPKLIGSIILADFLEYGVKKFITFVSDIESSDLYKRLVGEGTVTSKRLPKVDVLRRRDAGALAKAGVIAKVDGQADFSICYTAREFCTEYQIRTHKLASYSNDLRLQEEKKNVIRLLNKLRRINTRNLIIRRVLDGIVEHQRDYFASNDELNLKCLAMRGLARSITGSEANGRSLDFVVDASRISRAIRKLSLITPKGKQIPLTLFFPSRRDMVKRCIKAIVGHEKKEVGKGRAARAYTDEELSRKINEEHGLSVTRREIAYCRTELGILPYLRRNSYVYHTLAANFSQMYPFTASLVKKNAPTSPGVYELRLDSGEIEYPTGSCQTFYIGSAKNLRKRLLSHLSSSSKNGGIKEFTIEKSCLFRYVTVLLRWTHEEKRFYNHFVSTYGDSPICNHINPKVTSK